MNLIVKQKVIPRISVNRFVGFICSFDLIMKFIAKNYWLMLTYYNMCLKMFIAIYLRNERYVHKYTKTLNTIVCYKVKKIFVNND